MNSKERSAISAVENVCEEAVYYIGHANYPERERTALRNVRQAFTLFRRGEYDKIKWDSSEEEQ